MQIDSGRPDQLLQRRRAVGMVLPDLAGLVDQGLLAGLVDQGLLAGLVDQGLRVDHLVVGLQEVDLPDLYGSPHLPGARLQLGGR